MLLSEWIVLVVVTCAVMTAPAMVLAAAELDRRRFADWTSAAFGAVLVTVLLVSLAFRSAEFGVDTPAYLEVFRDHCAGRPLLEEDLTFKVSAALLDMVMLGTCHADLLPAAWGLLLVGATLMTSGPLALRLRYSALLLFSMIGIELATNALRQGLSVVFLVAAVSHWQRRRVAALVLGVLALSLHGSAPLGIAAFLLATLRWRHFLTVMGLLCAWVVWAVQDSSRWWIAEPFLYEVYKYLGHESDEFWVRVLVGGSLLAMVVTPLAGERGSGVRSHAEYWLAVKLALTSVPFLFLPYFGYRYVYAVAPLVLYLTLVARVNTGHGSAVHFAASCLVQALVLLAWSTGSSYMGSVPFFE